MSYLKNASYNFFEPKVKSSCVVSSYQKSQTVYIQFSDHISHRKTFNKAATRRCLSFLLKKLQNQSSYHQNSVRLFSVNQLLDKLTNHLQLMC